jgi:hypothetical protein
VSIDHVPRQSWAKADGRCVATWVRVLQVESAAKIIAELLVPVEDDRNEVKQRQLRELALINGTLRDEEYCNICGEKGHRQYECPSRQSEWIWRLCCGLYQMHLSVHALLGRFTWEAVASCSSLSMLCHPASA